MILRAFVRANIALSRFVDRALPLRVRTDGNSDFLAKYTEEIGVRGALVYDLGGGSRPFFSASRRRELALTVVGLDISAAELDAAPDGSYDRKVSHDLCDYRGDSDGDIVVCQSTLEHVPDLAGALRGIASCLKEGGVAYVFVPCRNAAFARLNLLLPEKAKQAILFGIFPEKAGGHDGFPAFYDRCTPSQLLALASEAGLKSVELRTYYKSSYFYAFFPAYLLWRLSQLVLTGALGNDAAETFSVKMIRKASL